jgi:metal-dependent amidase/aminoacylase/carboxypeptidase family protein
VVSITRLDAGTTDNVIPETAGMSGTIRSLDEAVRTEITDRLERIASLTAEALGATARFTFIPGYPVTLNEPAAAALVTEVGSRVFGPEAVHVAEPMMGAEDFAYFLQHRPGAYLFMGNGPSAGLHHPAYDFDDDALGPGISMWAALAEAATGR